jgi:doublecortin-like kinase 1/2
MRRLFLYLIFYLYFLFPVLQYLHDRMVCHRDIKPENLLVIDRLHTKSLKLADFGLAVTVREPLFTVCGTPTYVAPEILAETGYGVKVGIKKWVFLC